MIDDDDVGLPQKGLNNIIKDVLPDMRIANESRELLNQCCVEFVKYISLEAQRISSGDQRKTIYHDHVQKALKNLGFPNDYVEAANSVLVECKMAAEKRLKRKNSRLDKCGIPEEELYLMQQQLIEKARQEEAEKQHATQFGQNELLTAQGWLSPLMGAPIALGTNGSSGIEQPGMSTGSTPTSFAFAAAMSSLEQTEEHEDYDT
ncbi:histone-like transcription factor (CBF/NF-Y) and archaeal histone domain-containing protein [Ditylenchus destructor]|nr:histone-like transcription factor (CBF/NF-Y) and archaeal histone domain-containing protein [Ditylenchus destructor]